MILAISAVNENLDSEMDSRFGRAAGFVIFNTETNETSFIKNDQVMNIPSGAGIQSARHVVDSGAEALLTGHCGPKAFKALSAAGISIYTGASGSVKQVIAKFQAGEFNKSDGADVDGHWI